MPTIKTSIIIALVLGATVATAAGAVDHQTLDLSFAPSKVSVLERDGEVVVRYAGAGTDPAVGAPDLPVVTVWVEVPPGMRVTRVVADATATTTLGRHRRLAPTRLDRRSGDRTEEAAGAIVNRAATGADGAAGTAAHGWATVEDHGWMRGHRLALVRVRPVQWSPETGLLVLATRLRLETSLEPGGDLGLARHRVVPSIEARFEDALRQLVVNPSEVMTAHAGGTGVAGPGPYQPTFRPTLDGSPVEYVIVTSEELAPEFERLAEWKTAKGVRAAVRTIEWIDATYPNGVDRAERIRFFIRDAYQNWGTLFVLLGGDTDVVPPRYAETTFYQGESIPADMYYGCLEGNWNADGDGRFGEGISDGEPGDDVDLLFEVAIGRAPVSTPEPARDFVDKILLYERDAPSDSRYPASVLFLAERLFDEIHGAQLAEQAAALLPPWMRVVRLYEESAGYPGSIELTREAAIDSISAGFGIVHHVGHGYRNTMSVADGTINNPDADIFPNAPHNSVVFAINCSSASIDFNTIGERWIRNPGGGAIAYIGTSRLAFAGASSVYQNAWYTTVFQDSLRCLGIATDMARSSLLLGAPNDGSSRWNLMATTLLGDPETNLYSNAIAPLAVSHPSSHTLGSGPIAVGVTSSGSPVPGATVTLDMDDGSDYVTALTQANGSASLDFNPDGAGIAVLTVHKSNHRFYSTDLPIAAGNSPYLIVSDMAIDDDAIGASSGDDDAQADAGETIELTLTVRNRGGGQASQVTATLDADDPLGMLTITQDSVDYANIAPNGGSTGSGAFVISVDPAAPVAYQPILQVSISANQGQWTDTVPLPIRRSYLERLCATIDDALPRGNGNGLAEAGEEIWFTTELRNSGQDGAEDVAIGLRVLRAGDLQPHPQVVVGDAQSSFGDIDPGATVSGDRLEFSLGGSVDPSEVLLELTISDRFGTVRTELADIIPPSAIDAASLAAFGSPASIDLRWQPPLDQDVAGYDILRATAPGGPFMLFNDFLVEGSAAFEDRGLPSLTRFYYQIVTRDTSGNCSAPSAVVSGTTNPPLAAGWPIELAQQADSSPVVANVDPTTAEPEIFTASDLLYGWHADGEEILDGDDDGRTSGPFSLRGYNQNRGFGASTAIGDLDQDGDLELVNVGWNADSVFVWDRNGQIHPGWPKAVLDDFNWPSPALADLDVDGDLEVVVWAAKGGRLFAWHDDGTEVADGDSNPATDGVLTRIFGVSFNYSCPLVCNLDADPWLEIVIAVNKSQDNSGGVYAVNIDGSMVPGWPVFTGPVSEVSSSPAAADLDGDGLHEIVLSAERDGGKVYVLEPNGTAYPGWPKPAPARTAAGRLPSPVLADLDGDASLDIILPGTDGRLRAWSKNGTPLAGFPITYSSRTTEATQSTPSIGDIDGDGMPEIVFGDESGFLHAYNHDGGLVDGFPILTAGEVKCTPIIWDIDADNLIEIAATSFDANLYVWDLPFEFNPTRIPWPSFRHDTRNTGLVTSPVLPDGVSDPGPAPPAAALRLTAIRPNPMGPASSIGFDVPATSGPGVIELTIYDSQGRAVRRLLDAPLAAGSHRIAWDGRTDRGHPAASGIYFVRLALDHRAVTGKLTLLR